jgi:glycosyltransferase involved in cell wall biosynthesis
MKVSIIIPVLNSHEVVRRQVLHFEKMDLPDDVEIIMVDDGSVTEIEVHTTLKNFKLIHTHDFRAWTWALARNRGAREARGEYFIMADLDHIISRPFIDLVRGFNADHIRINREFAVLDENGNLTQDHEVLKAYGITQKRFIMDLKIK